MVITELWWIKLPILDRVMNSLWAQVMFQIFWAALDPMEWICYLLWLKYWFELYCVVIGIKRVYQTIVFELNIYLYFLEPKMTHELNFSYSNVFLNTRC